MSTEIRNVTLSFPCREDWEKFEVVPGGRLCTTCTHIVRDFRDCSMEQLREATKAGERVCGRFRKDQLSPKFAKAAALVAALTTVTACDTEMPISADPANSEQEDLMGDVILGDSSFVTVGIVVEVDSVEVSKPTLLDK